MGIRIKGLARDPGITALYYSVLLKWQNSEWRRLKNCGFDYNLLGDVEGFIKCRLKYKNVLHVFIFISAVSLTQRMFLLLLHLCLIRFVFEFLLSFEIIEHTVQIKHESIVLTSITTFFCNHFRQDVWNLKRPQIRAELFKSGSISIKTTPEAISVPITIPKSIKKTN